MSTATFFSMSAWSTLTTTASPEWSRARWTCPIEAEAIASGSNSANSSSIGRPNSASMSLRTTSGGSAGTLSWSCWNSSASLHAHQVGAGAEDLAQLDERRPQFGHGQPQAGFPGMPGDGRAAAGLQQVLGKIRPQPPDPRRQLVLAQHRQDLVPAAQVAVANLADFHLAEEHLDRFADGDNPGPIIAAAGGNRPADAPQVFSPYGSGESGLSEAEAEPPAGALRPQRRHTGTTVSATARSWGGPASIRW